MLLALLCSEELSHLPPEVWKVRASSVSHRVEAETHIC